MSQCVCLRVLTFEGRSEGGVRKAGQEVAVGRFLGQAGSKSGQGVAMVTELLQRNPFPQVGLQHSKRHTGYTSRSTQDIVGIDLLMVFLPVSRVQFSL